MNTFSKLATAVAFVALAACGGGGETNTDANMTTDLNAGMTDMNAGMTDMNAGMTDMNAGMTDMNATDLNATGGGTTNMTTGGNTTDASANTTTNGM